MKQLSAACVACLLAMNVTAVPAPGALLLLLTGLLSMVVLRRKLPLR